MFAMAAAVHEMLFSHLQGTRLYILEPILLR